MDYEILELNSEQTEEIDERLADFDKKYINYKLDGELSLGVKVGDRIVAGANGCMTAFHIFYISTVFVDEDYRGQGIGRNLMLEMERRAAKLGATMIRLDTFDWQGRDFYPTIGYEQVGFYRDDKDGFEEHFFIKRLG